MAVSISTSQTSTNATGADGLRRASNSIPNMNVWTALAKASINATSEYFNSMSKRRELEAQSNSLMYQAQTALMNSQIVESKLSLIPAMKDLNKIAIETNNSNVLNANEQILTALKVWELCDLVRLFNSSYGARLTRCANYSWTTCSNGKFWCIDDFGK